MILANFSRNRGSLRSETRSPNQWSLLFAPQKSVKPPLYLFELCSLGQITRKLPVLSGRQTYLARVLTLFYIGLCLADLCEPEALVHMGADPAIRDALQQYFHPARDHVGLVPHVPEVYAEGCFVCVH